MLEADFQRSVQELLDVHGWLWYHAADNTPRMGARGRTYVQNVRAGFPDLVATKLGALLFAELKGERGQLTDAQRDWHRCLAMVEAGAPQRVEVYVWYPDDWPAIVERLARVR